MRRASAIATCAIVMMLFLPARAEAACSITTTGVNFGNYNVFAASAADSTGSVTYDCSGNTSDIAITLSPGSSGTFNPRTMRQGAEALNYNLYHNAGYTNIWGDGTSGTSQHTRSNAPKRPVTLTIYGRIPAGQDVAAGSYSDSVVVTIQF